MYHQLNFLPPLSCFHAHLLALSHISILIPFFSLEPRLTHSHSPSVVSAPKVRPCNVWNQDQDNIVILLITLFLSDQQNKNTVLLFFTLLTLKHVLHGEQKSLNHNFIQLYVALPCAVKDKCFRCYTRYRHAGARNGVIANNLPMQISFLPRLRA